jgi:hypothetical protein
VLGLKAVRGRSLLILIPMVPRLMRPAQSPLQGWERLQRFPSGFLLSRMLPSHSATIGTVKADRARNSCGPARKDPIVVFTATERHAWMWRSSVAATVGVTSAAMAHVMLGGQLPGVLGFFPALVVTMILGMIVLRRRSTVGSVATALVGQWLFHELAILGAPYASSGHAHHAGAVWQPTILDQLPMTAGHVVAAAFTATAVILAHRVARVTRVLSSLLSTLLRRAVAPLQTIAVTGVASGLSVTTVGHDLARELFERIGYSLRAPPALS